RTADPPRRRRRGVVEQRGRVLRHRRRGVRLPRGRAARRRPGDREVVQRGGPAHAGRSSGRILLVRSLLTAAAISVAFTLFLTPVFVRLFRTWGWGQVIRTPEAIENPSHAEKRGTVTMGGTIFIAGTVVGYIVGCFVGANPPTVSGLLVLWMMIGLGAVGFIYDNIMVRRQRSLGLSGWRKVIGQVIVTVPFGILALTLPAANGGTPASAYVSIVRDVPWLYFFVLGPILGWLLYLTWVSFIGVAWSNSTNVTDGLDGLAAGCGVFVVGAYSLLAFWQFNQSCTNPFLDPATRDACYPTANPFDLAIVA